MADTHPSEEYPASPSSNGKPSFANDLVEDDPAAPTYANEPPDIAQLTAEIRRLDEAIIANSGNKFDTWWYALLDIDELDVAAAAKGRDDLTIAGLEENATNGNFYDRGMPMTRSISVLLANLDCVVPFEKILAERRNEGASWMFQDEFLVTRRGFSILRAEWHNTLHNAELKKGHAVRDAWEVQRDEGKGKLNRFSVAVWEERVRKDEELRWERRRVALERRWRAGESIQVGLVAWVEGRGLRPKVVVKDEKE